jgi:hypothetical protein
MLKTFQQEYDELNFRNKMLKQQIEQQVKTTNGRKC